MVTATNLVFSQSATERLYGKGAKLLSILKKVILVHIPGQKPKFVSKSIFKDHFNQRRIEESKKLEVAQCQGYWAVKSPSKGTFYVVSPCGDAEFICTCEDYKNQVSFWGKGRCKHIHAVRARAEIN